MEHILSLLLLFPALAALVAIYVPKENIRAFGIAITAIEFLLTIPVLLAFDATNPGFQFTEKFPLIPDYGVFYYVGIDGFSVYLLALSTFISFIAMAALEDLKNMKNLIITLLFMEVTMVGFFIALDAIVFYIFFELSLVPMMYIVGSWGSHKRVYAAIKFFLYTFTGSLIMLLGVIYLGYEFHQATGVWSFALPNWHLLVLPFDVQIWVFIAFFAGLAVKVPMFPFHTWLPYAHGQAPTVGSVILAAVLLKMGTYGFLRLNFPIMPDATLYFVTPVAILSLIMVVYAAMIAFAQSDMKQVIAYSSISHMGVIMLGMFALNVEGIAGSVFLMISHGIVSGALFMLVGVIYERLHTKEMSEFGGITSVMPKYGTIFGVVLMGSVGLPLTIGFVGEFLALLGFYKVSPVMTFIAGTTIILGAIYMLNVFRKSFFGQVANSKIFELKDLSKRELTGLIPLTLLVIILGVYPKPILEPAETSAKRLVELMFKKSQTYDAKLKLLDYNSIVGGAK